MVSAFLSVFRKFKWFFKNYRQISFEVRPVSNDKIAVDSRIFHGPVTYSTDGLVTSTNTGFMQEEKFKRAYAAASATNPWPGFTLQWRVYIVCWFGNMVRSLEGDYVECGVNTGAYAAALLQYTQFETLNKKFFLFDTFQGLDESQITEKEKEVGIDRIYLNAYKDVYAQVQETFSPFPSVKIIRGVVPETLPQCDSQKLCYLSIDMNVVKPEIDAIHFFWERLVKGAVILLDDYGFPHHVNQKLAFDEFATEKNVEILTLPTGQGLIIKPY